ncbi:MAG: hypothetical protein NW203_09865 [Hyphomonadaceae bacterium]|nr:hypothetical protein [Hyphomonadaceae bacterium]
MLLRALDDFSKSWARRRTLFACVIAGVAGLACLASPAASIALLAALAALITMHASSLRIADALRALAPPGAAAIAVGLTWGWDGALGVIMLWRLFEDARWSAGEARRLQRLNGERVDRGLRAAHLWLTPAFAAALIAHTAPHLFIGLPLDLPHAPAIAPMLFGAAAMLALIDWAIRQATDWRLGAFDAASAAHSAAHHGVFLLAYVASPDLSAGAMAMIAWRLAHALPSRGVQASFTAVP